MTYGMEPGVLKRSEAPFALLARGDEGLDRVAFGYRVGLASRHRPPTACIKATSGLRKRTSLTSPTSRLPFSHLSKSC